MKGKTAQAICGAICVTGFFFVAGTVGALENDSITIGQGILQSIIGIAAFAGAGHLGGFIDG